jgi:hypothetical protein
MKYTNCLPLIREDEVSYNKPYHSFLSRNEEERGEPIEIYDPYQIICDRLNEVAGSKYERSATKGAIMTTVYNSIASPQKTFGKDYDNYMSVMNLMFGGALKVMELLNKCFDPMKDIHSWKLPDGFTVYMPTHIPSGYTIPSPFGNIDFMGRKLAANPNQWRSLVPNVVHSIDGWIAREVIRRAFDMGIRVASIHDCFTFSFEYYNEVRVIYSRVMWEVQHSNLLEFIILQLRGKEVSYNKGQPPKGSYVMPYAIS